MTCSAEELTRQVTAAHAELMRKEELLLETERRFQALSECNQRKLELARMRHGHWQSKCQLPNGQVIPKKLTTEDMTLTSIVEGAEEEQEDVITTETSMGGGKRGLSREARQALVEELQAHLKALNDGLPSRLRLRSKLQ
mmetsp:Transcript_1526/g.2091  ORF Transcript_1526/g.2091 Transcript_1526/m.2091 type:complete len:140 (+) Transcript_1526:129-548(+)